jgi:hypothetical protein
MKALLPIAGALCASAILHARPVFLEETARIPNPDPNNYVFGSGVGIDGDNAIVLGYKSIPDPDGNEDTQRTVFLFRLVNGTWTHVRSLASTLEDNEMDGPEAAGVDLGNGFAALALQPFQIHERAGTDYVQRFVATDDSRTEHVQIDRERVVFGGGCWGGSVFVRDAAGTWRTEGSLQGDNCGSSDGATGGPVALADPWAAVSNPWNFEEELPGPAVTIFLRTGTSPNAWQPWQRLVAEPGHYTGKVAFQDFRLFVEDLPQFGTAIYERGDSEWWLSPRRLVTGGEWMTGFNTHGSPYTHDRSVEASPDYVMRHAYDHFRDSEVIHVFQYGLNEYLHVATLVPGDGGYFTGQISISGRRVLVAGSGHAYYYELPATLTAPGLLQDTFDATTAPGWSVLPGSRFSIAQRSDSRVFRQSNTAGEAGAVFNAANWTNQAIQADVRPRALSGNDPWVGLFTRRVDASNYYYVTLRHGGELQLKRMVGGRFETMARMWVPLTLHRNYRLRLESIGSLHRVYVNGDRLLEARDASHAQGRPGLLSYRVAADYDNVVVSPAPTLTVYERNEGNICVPACVNPGPWNYGGGQWTWGFDGGNSIFQQTSLTDWARVFAGQRNETSDSVVEATARLRAFGGGNDPWFGVLAGTGGDASGYTYLALRKSNTVTLRKVISGQITQLGTAVFNVTPGAWYRLRLEIVGNRVRGYVNGRLVLEAIDNHPLLGVGGMVTYRTQADFDDFRAVQP